MGGSAANGAEQAHLATAIHVGQHVKVLAQRLAPHAWVDPSILLQTQSRTELPGRPSQPARSDPHIPHCTTVFTTGQLSCREHLMPEPGS